MAQLHLYLNRKKLEACGQFGRVTTSEGIEDRLGTKRVYSEDDRYYIIVSPDLERVSDSLKDLVESVSLYDHIPISPRRERGTYTHETATAEIDIERYRGENSRHIVKINGPKLSDVRELFRRIKVGSIRPKESHDGPQSGKSRAELEDEVNSLRIDLQKLDEALKSERKAHEAMRYGIRVLANSLRDAKWPLGNKMAIAGQLDKILKG